MRQALFYFSQWIALLCLKHNSTHKECGSRPPQALRQGWFAATLIVKEQQFRDKKHVKNKEVLD